ncbi:DUF6446 family protein [Antarctobacter heliothermus]|uniref:Histidine kinase n=1 Tax=Antarctobacter heliothermus TaxID=74033 RepID=A0A239BB75_9RHOB|nr:hypothetical protein SAMN04488078_1002151 [Antarctobacter heliothermus]
MTAGKLMVLAIVLCGVIAGVSMYYLQVYHFYKELPATGPDDVLVTTLDGDRTALPHSDFRAIDADSSPIRYRACFTTDVTPAQAAVTYEPYEGAEPRVAPGWFDCFDAETIGTTIADGKAGVFVGQRNIEYGIDRVVAITEDGHGYVWHEINDCGDKAYDGTPLGDDCPDRASFEKDQ